MIIVTINLIQLLCMTMEINFGVGAIIIYSHVNSVFVIQVLSNYAPYL